MNSAFGIVHKADRSGAEAGGAVLAGGAAVGTYRAGKQARKLAPVARGAGMFHAVLNQDPEELARHLKGAKRDAKVIGGLHAATPVLGLTAAALGAAALANRRRAPQ